MAKRFTATEIWNEDWFLDMPNEYKLFWYYMLSNCNHAGLFRVNLRSFCGQLGVKVGVKDALMLFNAGKQRIREITSSIWLIEDFFVYQYGAKLNTNNRVHASIVKEYDKYEINLTSIRGLIDLKDGVKDKDKDKDKDITNIKEYNIGNNQFLKNSNLNRQPTVPSKVDVWEVFSRCGGTKEMAKSFYEKYDGTGWFLNGSPIINFSALANKFIDNWKRGDEKRNGKVDTSVKLKLK